MQQAETERDVTIDILKGIAIILMVLGHSGISEEIVRFIYLFHMSVFVIATGYCYNENYSKGNWLIFLKKRIQSLYLPYFLWMLLLIMLHNCCISMNIYTNSPGFLEGVYGNQYGLNDVYTIKDFARESIKALFMFGREQLFGAAWFIRVLFYMQILWCAIDNLFMVFSVKRIKAWRFGISVALLGLGGVMKRFDFFNFSELPTILTSYILFTCGFYIREWWKRNDGMITIKHGMVMVIMSFFALSILFGLGTNTNLTSFDNPCYFLISSLAGWIILYYIALMIVRVRRTNIMLCLCYIGKNTMPIVLFHFMAFKVITIMEIMVYQLPWFRLASFPIYRSCAGWWILYAFVGIVIPLGIDMVGKIFAQRVRWENGK